MKAKLLSLIFLFSLASCGGSNIPSYPSYEPQKDLTSPLYVKRVDKLTDSFMLGMDSSQVIALEKSGVKYYNFKGEQEDVFKILKDNGINTIRVRIWNDPFDKDGHGYGGGNCDINVAVAIAERAAKYSLNLMPSFHYSDFWADPSKQFSPKAWSNLDSWAQVGDACYNFTKDCLNKIKQTGVNVTYVSVGNETNGGKVAGSTTWSTSQYIFKGGARAVREVLPKAKVVLHFANPEKTNNYRDYAEKLKSYKIDYDVFGSSYYPYWHGTLDNLYSILEEISKNYDKDVMVMENSYAFNELDTDFSGNTIPASGIDVPYPYTVQGQAREVRDVIDTITKLDRGVGYCYWEGTWIGVGTSSWEENSLLWERDGSGWASSYASVYDPDDAGKYYGGCAVENQAFFDASGKPLDSLKVFNLIKAGNEVPISPDAIADTNLTFDYVLDEVELPDTVSSIMNDGSSKQVKVTWQKATSVSYTNAAGEKVTETIDVPVNEELFEAMKGFGVADYTIVGDAEGKLANCYVKMIEYNYLDNWSFEDGEKQSAWELIDNYKGTANQADELYIEDKKSDSLTGTFHGHFWSDNTKNVDITIKQKVKDLTAGKYKFSLSIMGGDCADQENYLFVSINGEEAYTISINFSTYGNWDTKWINDITIEDGDEVYVGVHIKCGPSGNGAWGKIDDGYFNAFTK